jgi:hypothetical protein
MGFNKRVLAPFPSPLVPFEIETNRRVRRVGRYRGKGLT